jgi:hypothetical protein
MMLLSCAVCFVWIIVSSSIGVLVPPLRAYNKNDSIDLVFITYWIHPVSEAQLILGKDKEYIEKKQAEAESNTANGKHFDSRPLLYHRIRYTMGKIMFLKTNLDKCCFYLQHE